MNEVRTIQTRIGCLSCLGLIVVLGAAIGISWGLMTGLAGYIAGLFS